MKSLLIFCLIMNLSNPQPLYKSSNYSQTWIVIDDVVMGGVSNSSFSYSKEGYTQFKGTVSTAYNGGFSSMHLRCNTTNIKDYNTIVLRVKGDGKRYQFRLKEQLDDTHNFTSYFETNGNWETIEIPLKNLSATFRGRTLNHISFSNTVLEEIGILIGNKTNETFQLLIDAIYLK